MIKKPAIALGALSIFLLGASCDSTPDAPRSEVAGLNKVFQMDTLVIEALDGTKHDFDIYLAIQPAQQRQGLMYVRQMPENVGMLFVYSGSGVHSMWMKNTHISLDIVFAFDDGVVSSVIENTEPYSLKSLSSVVPVTYVLELNAGTAERLKIGPKSRLIWDGLDDESN
jgi:uncharacterized membrane protein (UPF0127 family)